MCVDVNITQDDVLEDVESFLVVFSSSDFSIIVNDGAATVMIIDDDCKYFTKNWCFIAASLISIPYLVSHVNVCMLAKLRVHSFTYFAYVTVMEVGFDPAMNFVNESVGSYEVCVFLSGQIERDVSVQVVSSPASSPGKQI